MTVHVFVEATRLYISVWRLHDCTCMSGGYMTVHVYGGYMTVHVCGGYMTAHVCVEAT